MLVELLYWPILNCPDVVRLLFAAPYSFMIPGRILSK